MTREERKEKLNRDKYHKERKHLIKLARKMKDRKLERKEENFCSMLARGIR